MKILRAYKTELDPNNKQRTFFSQCVGASRFVYNWGLAEWKRQYEAGEKPSQYGLCKLFNAQKDNICLWIRDLPYAISESAFANLNAAFQNFFRRIKTGEKLGYPKFKKRGVDNSFQIKNTKIESGCVRITGIGWIKLKERDYIPINASRYGTYATVSERADRWFISVFVEEEIEPSNETMGKPIGVDLGIKNLAVCSNGKTFENPKSLSKQERKLKHLQRELSRRKKGSSRREQTKKKIAKCYLSVSNVRKHTLHEVSHYVAVERKPETIVLEDLNVSGMMKNHHLAKSISDASFSELRRQIEYKAEWNGIEVQIADRFYPSSKTCSNCGCKKEKLDLSERVFRCENCGFELDRDLNAARNLALLANMKAETQPDCAGS